MLRLDLLFVMQASCSTNMSNAYKSVFKSMQACFRLGQSSLDSYMVIKL